MSSSVESSLHGHVHSLDASYEERELLRVSSYAVLWLVLNKLICSIICSII